MRAKLFAQKLAFKKPASMMNLRLQLFCALPRKLNTANVFNISPIKQSKVIREIYQMEYL